MAANINLSEVWEWDPVSGNPVIPADDVPNGRYCPMVAEMDEHIKTQTSVPDNLKLQLWEFMTSNETRMTTYINPKQGRPRPFLRLIRALNFKKIQVEYVMGGNIIIDKLPRTTPFTGQPYGVENNMRISQNASVYLLVRDINFNSLLGWVGPGTFPCCNLCNYVGRTTTINLGPQGQLELTKRATCDTQNAVYVGTCRRCAEEDAFTCYFGESGVELRRRYAHHQSKPCNSRSILQDQSRFRTIDQRRTEIARVIAARSDPEEVLRDWFSHVTDQGVHSGHQQISVVDIVPHSFPRQNRERILVEQYMFRNGDFLYLGMGKGCLNTYGLQ